MKKFGTLRVFLLILLVGALSVAPTLAFALKKDDVTRERLFGETSKLQGVLTVWNIDTFEGGNMGKAAFLEAQARTFEKQHKGLYVLVENLTLEEFSQRKNGTLPDVISFGSGIYSDVAPLIESNAKLNENVLENVAKSVAEADVAKVYPWCMGGYFLLTSTEALEKCNKEEVDLKAERFDLGYSKTIGKKTREVKSLTLGTGTYHSAFAALETLGDVNILALDENYASQTGYEAYVRFCGNNASVLLGSQRDLARLENKLSQGAISGLETEFIEYTDMVQYVQVTNGLDALHREYAEKFCQFLQTEKVQEALLKVNILPVYKLETESNVLIAEEIKDKLSTTKIKKLY